MTSTGTAPSASTTSTTCSQANFSRFPTTDAACAIGSTTSLPSNTSAILSQCCHSAPVEPFNGNCGYYCLSVGQSIRDLQTCFMDNGARPADILCNANNSATATASPSASASASRTSGGSAASATGKSGAPASAAVSKMGLGMLGMVLVSALAGAMV